MSNPFFPLYFQQAYKITLQRVTENHCVCGHEGYQHLKHGNQTCMVAECSCNKYSKYDPKFSTPQDFEAKALEYFESQKTMLESVRWVFENLLFFRNYNNDELGWAWGKFVLGYDPFSQFMNQEIYNKIKKYGTHSTIEREARRLREECRSTHKFCSEKTHENCNHECKYCPFDPSLIDHKLMKQYGMHTFFGENRVG